MLKKPDRYSAAPESRQGCQILDLQFSGNQPGAEESGQLSVVPIEIHRGDRIVQLVSKVLQAPWLLLAGTFKLMHRGKISLTHRCNAVAIRQRS